MSLNSIYCATEGEGIHIGTPQTFVRFQGCDLQCKNCDSVDTWNFDRGMKFSLNEVIDKIISLKMKRVSITGGDPLNEKHLENVLALVKELRQKRFYVNIEVSGNKIDNRIFDLVDFISFDFKTPSSGINTEIKLVLEMQSQFSGKFQIKSVIETHHDFLYVLKAAESIKFAEKHFSWCLTPAYNIKEEFPLERFKSVLKWNEENGSLFRIIGQQHKWIFGPDTKQV